jgi:hypothetical protein
MRRRAILALVAVLAFASLLGADGQNSLGKTLLPTYTITAAATTTSEVMSLGQIPAAQAISVQAVFVYGSGGTTAKAYVQTSLDNGVTWIDVASFAFATATATKVSAVNIYTAVAAAVTPTDGTLTDNTILSGIFGDRLRVKLITAGTYAGTTIKVSLVQR